MPLPTDVEELRAEGVALVAGSITDLAGVTRAKYVPLRRLESFQRAGMGVSPLTIAPFGGVHLSFTSVVAVPCTRQM